MWKKEIQNPDGKCSLCFTHINRIFLRQTEKWVHTKNGWCTRTCCTCYTWLLQNFRNILTTWLCNVSVTGNVKRLNPINQIHVWTKLYHFNYVLFLKWKLIHFLNWYCYAIRIRGSTGAKVHIRLVYINWQTRCE